MKTLLRIDSDVDTTIVSGDVTTKEELYQLAVALASLFIEEDDLSDAVFRAVDALIERERKNKKQKKDQITIDIESLIKSQHKS